MNRKKKSEKTDHTTVSVTEGFLQTESPSTHFRTHEKER